MGYRDPKKESDLFSMIEHQQSVLKASKGSTYRMSQMAMDRLRAIGLAGRCCDEKKASVRKADD